MVVNFSDDELKAARLFPALQERASQLFGLSWSGSAGTERKRVNDLFQI